MKKLLCYAATCLLAVSAFSQTVVTTPIMGFLTLNLQTGTNFMGFALLPAMELQGVVNISGGERKTLTLQGVVASAIADDQFNTGTHATHIVEIASGPGAGFTSIILDTVGGSGVITVANSVPGNVADGATVKIWKLWTLAQVFGADNAAGLTAGASPQTADIIQVPNGNGFDAYFYSDGSGSYTAGWRKAGEFTADQSAVPVQFDGGVSVFARAAKSVVIVGQVKPGQTQVNLNQGINVVANLCPVQHADSPTVGRTLKNSGLENGLDGGVTSESADLVLIWNNDRYDQYYFSTGGLAGPGWRQIGQGAAVKDSVSLPDGAYLILRRGEAKRIQIAQGAF